MKISQISLEVIKQSEVNYSSKAWTILQDYLLGTVEELNPGDVLNINANDWQETLDHLVKEAKNDSKVKIQATIRSYKYCAASNNHNYDKKENQAFMQKLARLLSDWIS